MNIRVGDRATYKTFGETKIALIVDDEDIDNIQEDIKNKNIEILKIGRPQYEVVEEKKELLTGEEREFLKLYMDFTHIITDAIYKKDGIINFIGYTTELALYKGFNKLIENKHYTLKELGLEEK